VELSATTSRGNVRQRTTIGFGLLCAYVLPGFTVLASLSLLYEPLQIWLVGPAQESPAIGGVLYVTAASILLGQLLNVLRWAVLDWVFTWTGIRRPVWDERLLPERLQAFELLVENHYRYFQFYGNLAVAIPISLIAVRQSVYSQEFAPGSLELFALALFTLLLAGSRDALRQYFTRSSLLFGKDAPEMTNGNHPKGDTQKDKPATKVTAAAGSDKPKESGDKK